MKRNTRDMRLDQAEAVGSFSRLRVCPHHGANYVGLMISFR